MYKHRNKNTNIGKTKVKEGRKKVEKILKEKLGITLISLVITIIVLLILAGVTIGVLVGEDGIITRATKAEEETKKSQYEELINIIILEKKIERSQNPKEEEPFIKSVADAIDQKEWSKTVTICDEYGNTEIEVEKCNKIIVETKDGYEIIVNIDNENLTGEVVSITKGKTPIYTIKFEANGGKGEVPKAIQIRKGFSIKLPKGEHLSQTDQKIVGWSKVERPENEKDKIYTIGSSYQPNEEITILYAIWADDTVTITFDENTGEGQMEPVLVGSGKTTTLPNNTFTKYGYHLKEWNTKIGGDGTSYPDGGEINISQDTTLYAIWEEVIVANVSITNNKITEATKITLGGSAIANGIQKVELKVGNNILYTEEINGDFHYNKSNLGLNDLNQTALKNLDFYDITVEMIVTSTTGKTGTTSVKVNNYTIGNNDALRKFTQIVNSGNSLKGEAIIQLTNLSTYENDPPIGLWKINTDESYPFSGSYDGKGYKVEVKNRWLNYDYASGFFGYIEKATIKNLTVYGYNTRDYSYYGGICGVTWASTIQDCCNDIKSTTTTGVIKAGIVGWARADCTIERCYNIANIVADHCVGGIIGWLSEQGSRVNSCYNTGNIETIGKNSYGQSLAGGIIGANSDLRIGNSEMTNCYNTGSIKGYYSAVGGLIGTCNTSAGGRLIVRNCYDVGSVSGSGEIGSLHGYATHIDYYNTYSIFEDPNAYWEGCKWDALTKGGISVDSLKGMAGTLGSAYKTDTTGINGGYPILTWQ